MNEHGKIVHRPCSSCISSVQELNKNSIEFFLSTQTWSTVELFQAKSLQEQSNLIDNTAHYHIDHCQKGAKQLNRQHCSLSHGLL